jgi:hypothetical protein
VREFDFYLVLYSEYCSNVRDVHVCVPFIINQTPTIVTDPSGLRSRVCGLYVYKLISVRGTVRCTFIINKRTVFDECAMEDL